MLSAADRAPEPPDAFGSTAPRAVAGYLRCGIALGLGGLAVCWLTRPHWHWTLIGAQALARWGLLPAYPLAVWALRSRDWPVAALAIGAAAGQLAATATARGGGSPDAPGADHPVRLATANLLVSNDRPEAVPADLLATAADVIVLQEVTPALAEALADQTVSEAYPYQLLDPLEGYHGSALLSRWPLTDSEVLDLDGRPMTAATVQTPGGPLRVIGVHAVNPVAAGELGRWRRQLQILGRLAAEAGGAVVVAGDFNGTLDHAPLRALLDSGLRDSYAVAGRGFASSWPHGHRLLPALILIDHVLLGSAVGVSAVRLSPTPGSDHRKVVADLVLRRAADPP